jgi:GNAT superfamily N-acetyltransferase
MSPELDILQAETVEHVEAIRTLFTEYWDSFGFTPCFQGFGDELASLPGKYGGAGGRLALAVVGEEPAGCVALRRIDAGRCEFKRLYVKPEFRGHQVGKALMEWVIAEARGAGYVEMLCDTMPVMQDALRMYERTGFERTGPYLADATPGAIYLRLRL